MKPRDRRTFHFPPPCSIGVQLVGCVLIGMLVAGCKHEKAQIKLSQKIRVDESGCSSMAALDNAGLRLAVMTSSGTLYEVRPRLKKVSRLLEKPIGFENQWKREWAHVKSVPQAGVVLASWGRVVARLEWPECHSVAATTSMSASVWWITPSPDGDTVSLSLSDGTLWVWEPETGRSFRNAAFHCPPGEVWSHGVGAVAMSPKGGLAAVIRGGRAEIWRGLSTSCSLVAAILSPRDARAQALAFSPTGESLYFTTAGGYVTAYSILRQKYVGWAHVGSMGDDLEDWLWAVAVSPNGKFVAAAGWDGTVYLLNEKCRSVLSKVRVNDGYTVAALLFSASGREIIACDMAGYVSVLNVLY